MTFLTEIEKGHLRKYKYNGGDLSLTYKYVLSPIAQFCVDNFVPMNVAPNLITFVGLLQTLIVSALTVIYNPDLSPNSPRWLNAMTGVAILVYQTLDNMDGKQARRTGSSSPLGMLFDHGCDAINAAVSVISVSSVLGAGWNSNMFLCMFCGFVPFYFQTWEEYYVGSMILPLFNGPSEGLIITASLGMIAAMFPGFWTTPNPMINLTIVPNMFPFITEPLGLTRADFVNLEPRYPVLVFGALWGSVILIMQIISVLKTAFKRGQSIFKALLDLTPFLTLYIGSIFWISASSIAFQKYPYVSFALISTAFIDSVTHLMLMHICHSPVKTFKRYFSYSIGLLAVIAMSQKCDHCEWKATIIEYDLEKRLLFSCAFGSVLYTTYTLYKICTEVADDLGIYVFVLGKKDKLCQ